MLRNNNKPARGQPAAQLLKSAIIPDTSVGYLDGSSASKAAKVLATEASDLEKGEASTRRSASRSSVPAREDSVRSDMLSAAAAEAESQLAVPGEPPVRRKRESRRLPRPEERQLPEQQNTGNFLDAVVSWHGAVTAALFPPPKPPPVQVERSKRRTRATAGNSPHLAPEF